MPDYGEFEDAPEGAPIATTEPDPEADKKALAEFKTLGEAMKAYRSHIDSIKEIEERLKVAKRERFRCEAFFIAKARIEGVDKFSGEGISVTVGQSDRAVYDPEKWETILESLVKTGHGYLLHRRLSDSKLADLVVAGFSMPPGLQLRPITVVRYRRV